MQRPPCQPFAVCRVTGNCPVTGARTTSFFRNNGTCQCRNNAR